MPNRHEAVAASILAILNGTDEPSDHITANDLYRSIKTANDEEKIWYVPTVIYQEDHHRQITDVRIHPTGKMFATAAANRVNVYDAEFDRLLFTFVDPDVEEEFLTLDWTRNGDRILAAGKQMTIRILPVQGGGEVARPMQGHGGPINVIRASVNHPEWVLSASDDYSCRLWDVQAGKALVRYAGVGGHVGRVTAMDEHPSGGRFVSCSDDCVCVWAIEKQYRSRKTIHEHFPIQKIQNVHKNPPIRAIQWLGSLLVSVALQGPLLVWSPLKEGSIVARLPSKREDSSFSGFTIDPTTMAMCAADSQGDIRMWDLITAGAFMEKATPVIYTHKWSVPGEVTCLDFNGKLLVACCADEVGIWQRKSSSREPGQT